MSNIILNKNFVWEPCGGRLGHDPPDLPVELLLVGGIASMILGG